MTEVFVVGYNQAGCMPDSFPDAFGTFEKAKRVLLGTIKFFEEDADDDFEARIKPVLIPKDLS